MSSSDGSVLGVTKIVDHGPDTSRWNLVVLGDGYEAGELGQYHTDVQAFVDVMRVTPPFDNLWSAINVHRVDVTSTDSGADDPTTCAGGTGATPATYFDSTFCSAWGGGNLDRLLTCDSTLAQTEAKAQVPLVHQAVVVVNSSKYGGSGGDIATFSTHAQAAEIAIHEIGHSAFGLADEYEGSGSAPATEPDEPNVTLDANRATNKWRHLVLATTPMPTRCNAACTTSSCTPPATPAATTLTGAWEGGQYTSCDVYRPAFACYMRDYSPFCEVCTEVIRAALNMYLPAESITLTTSSIDFRDIPEGIGGTGVTTWRAVRWEVITSRSLTFRVVTGPTGPFTLPQGGTVTVGPGAYLPSAPVRIWLAYTSASAGSTASGSVTVRCDETGQQWTVPITANTVARKTAEAVLVLDRSGSMDEDAGDGTKKIDKLREAATIFVEAMLPGDGIGLVRFSNNIHRLKDVQDVGAPVSGAGRVDAIAKIAGSQMNPAGRTAIGGALQEGAAALADGQAGAATPYDVEALVVLTDGQENEAPFIDDVAGSITAHTFAIGLGLPYNIDVDKLNRLTQSNNGYLLVTGTLTPDQRRLLTKYFLQVLAGITNAQVVLDPGGDIGVGEEQLIPFSITEADYGMDAIVLTDLPGALTYELEAPDGTRIDPAMLGALGTGLRVDRDAVSYYRAGLPVDPGNPRGTHGGTWHVVLRLDRERLGDAFWRKHPEGRLPYDVVVHSWSSLLFRASARQDTLEPGAEVRLFATLTEYDVVVGADRSTVWADVLRPDGHLEQVDLSFVGPGWSAAYSLEAGTGLYRIRVRASGSTFAGELFTREQTVTAHAATGYERPGEEERPEKEGRRPKPWWWGRLLARRLLRRGDRPVR
ncbi:M64 family metallopeptidase [Ornithinimicrobium pekingense]|uniref:VWFA domain-containing protein n=1 Tax=Ornithinimicrobium pekingense TaxID=384677 RepID=A0ABQ2FBT6_9MICO|nr:M64 family metallopeptidase [Ornithinimicrobium pekingense]GGK79124.1 hypothetical protein GCM10011509_29590 [Ornithinimicrobium pekingense]